MEKRDENLTILEGFENWIINNGKSENTVKTYLGVLNKFQQWLSKQNKEDLSQLKQEDIQAYMDFLSHSNRSASTIDKVFAAISVFSKYIDKTEVIKNIEKKEKESHIYKTVPETLTSAEKNDLLLNVKKDNNIRNIAIVHTLLYTGIRISELCDLNYDDIQLSKNKGTIKVSGNQGNHSRVIPLSSEVLEQLQNYIYTLPKKEGPLFLSSFNKRMTTRSVQYMLKKYNVTPHKLRHTFCQDLINQGLEPSIVAQLSGHNDVNVTKRYLRSNEDNEQSLA